MAGTATAGGASGGWIVHTTAYSDLSGTPVPMQTLFGLSDPAGGFVPIRTAPPLASVRHTTATATALTTAGADADPGPPAALVPFIAGSLFAGLMLTTLIASVVFYRRKKKAAAAAARRAGDAPGKETGADVDVEVGVGVEMGRKGGWFEVVGVKI